MSVHACMCVVLYNSGLSSMVYSCSMILTGGLGIVVNIPENTLYINFMK